MRCSPPHPRYLLTLVLAVVACTDPPDKDVVDTDRATDAADDTDVDGVDDTADTGDTGDSDPPSCFELGYAAGDRYAVGDSCNFCDCNGDGSSTCTTRTCTSYASGCEYDGAYYAYGERFLDTLRCNTCVCAASGLACTRRACTTVEEGAILVESLDASCGDDPLFTAQAVLDSITDDDFEAALTYATERDFYPETLPDTAVRVRVVYDEGFAVCRIPGPGQEAWDIEVVAEWITEDGAFDEGFHTYVRRTVSAFDKTTYLMMAKPKFSLDGTYDPSCLDENGFTFSVAFAEDGTIAGDIGKTCETDIGLTVATFAL